MPLDPQTASTVTAVDIGGTHVSSALVARGQEVRQERRDPLDADAAAEVILDRIADCAREHSRRSERVALAIPGPFDYARGHGDFKGVAKFAQLSGVDMRGGLAARWDRDPASVRFVNDAEAFGLGEWAAGAGARVDRCVAITLGTGIGSAFVDRGRCLSSGPEVPPDGNLHLAEVDGSPVEDLVSRRALRQAYRERTGRLADVAEIAACARTGDRDAIATLETGMDALGRALAPWLQRFGAERLVIGGSMAASEDLLLPTLRRRLAASLGGEEQVPHVARGVLPTEQASMIGAVLGTSEA
ncbi:ROK family protein [Brachybacterium sp. GCM10030267]|uniref:ROK family protein n=1 Tax=unclassified Brachybacterium TaxID=2623841 RepID=UPI003606528B